MSRDIHTLLVHFFSSIASSNSVVEVLSLMDGFFKSIEANHYNYTHINAIGKKHHYMMYHNYDQSWVQKYQTHKYYLADPTILHCKISNKIASWNECSASFLKNFSNSTMRSIFKQMQESVQKREFENALVIPIVSEPYTKHAFYLIFEKSVMVSSQSLRAFASGACFALNNVITELERNVFHKPEENDTEKFPFTPKECEVISLIYRGKERKDIAEIMDISVNTVDATMKRIFLKAKVNSKVQLIVKIISKGWLGMFV